MNCINFLSFEFQHFFLFSFSAARVPYAMRFNIIYSYETNKTFSINSFKAFSYWLKKAKKIKSWCLIFPLFAVCETDLYECGINFEWPGVIVIQSVESLQSSSANFYVRDSELDQRFSTIFKFSSREQKKKRLRTTWHYSTRFFFSFDTIKRSKNYQRKITSLSLPWNWKRISINLVMFTFYLHYLSDFPI